jgi:hypothetical protein
VNPPPPLSAIRVSFRDESHLRAHADHFAVPIDEALRWALARLEASPRRTGWEHFDFEAPEVVGLTGLKTLWPWTRGDFWARRRGRTLPSHLIVGSRHPTRWLCVHGLWQGETSFLLHTIYPGRVAPREIHDPELSLRDLPAALKFWRRHAIIVGPAEWEARNEPHPGGCQTRARRGKMDPMLNRTELLRALERSYSRFIGEIEKLEDDQLAIVGVTKLWSVRDLLAHMLFWHDRVERRAAGKPVEWDQGPGESREACIARLNARAVADMAHMSGRQILGRFKESYARILRLAGTISDEQLNDRALMESFLGDTYGHYDEHFAGVQEFVARQAKHREGNT